VFLHFSLSVISFIHVVFCPQLHCLRWLRLSSPSGERHHTRVCSFLTSIFAWFLTPFHPIVALSALAQVEFTILRKASIPAARRGASSDGGGGGGGGGGVCGGVDTRERSDSAYPSLNAPMPSSLSSSSSSSSIQRLQEANAPLLTPHGTGAGAGALQPPAYSQTSPQGYSSSMGGGGGGGGGGDGGHTFVMPPRILIEPQSQVVPCAADVTFVVVASDDAGAVRTFNAIFVGLIFMFAHIHTHIYTYTQRRTLQVTRGS
jgi:hypothetical protein